MRLFLPPVKKNPRRAWQSHAAVSSSYFDDENADSPQRSFAYNGQNYFEVIEER